MSHDIGAECKCSAVHHPPVLEYEFHHIWPKGMGGPDVPANRIAVCPTAHANIHELLRLMVDAKRALSDNELRAIEDRPVSLFAGRMAREGFLRWMQGTA